MTGKTLVIGSDHAGFGLKKYLVEELRGSGYEVMDIGTDSEEAVDYPDIARDVCRLVSGKNMLGILVCGTGIGMSIAANKIHGIRAARCASVEDARLSVEHNNSNVLCLGGRTLNEKESLEILKAWLCSDFGGEERHLRRIGKIEELQNR